MKQVEYHCPYCCAMISNEKHSVSEAPIPIGGVYKPNEEHKRCGGCGQMVYVPSYPIAMIHIVGDAG